MKIFVDIQKRRRVLNHIGPCPEPYLIVSSLREIAVVDLTSVYKKSIIQARFAISNIVIDPVRQLLYFQDHESIYQSNSDGSSTSPVPVSKNIRIWTFTFDWLDHKRFFFVKSHNKRLIMSGFVDFHHYRQFVKHTEDILSLAVDPSYG